MSLEDDIQQKAFKSEHHKLVINIIYTSKWLEYKHLKSLKPFDITPEQYNLLRILRGRHPEPATVQYITERMLDKNSNASRLVDKLIAKGFVERKTCPADRRAVDVTISEQGLGILADLDVEEMKWASSMDELSAEEAALVNNALDKVRAS
jgi:DNA-binding MarR family transcriptional regulator